MRRAAVVLVGVSLMLAGCVSVFPKASPEQLYRFGVTAASPAPVVAGQTRFAVEALPIDFERASAGDLILTMNGDEAAYIKGARWITGAASLFEQALGAAFANDHGAARLMARGEAVRPDYLLKLSVRSFEARYAGGPDTAPTVVVEVYAALSRPAERALVGERTFSASVPASANRVSAIAHAFDQAVGQVLGELTGWVDATGAAYSAAKPA